MIQHKLFALITGLAISSALMAQGDMISFGLRGGGNIYMATGDAHAKLGYGGNFDLAYTHYWLTPDAEVGIRTGITIGACNNHFEGTFNRSFVNRDYEGNDIEYTVSSNSVELKVVRQVQFEIPLMLAVRAENVFINLGVKYMMPIYDKYEQNMNNITIDAYYRGPDVHVTNRLITGLADENQLRFSGKGCIPKHNILFGTEIGYEWAVTPQDRIGLGLYLDISPWSSFQKPDGQYLIDVAPINNPEYPPAKVTIQPLYTASVDKLLYCDFGIKFYYGLNLTKK